ncbi:MAG: ABC transporter ATP-binding protein [Tepidiformaceae bacterium]
MNMLEAKAMTKTYGSREEPIAALRGVDFSLQAGEFVAVMGPSGCGKSTLLHLLGGLDRPTSGELYFEGQRVDGLSETAWAVLRRRKVGYVFQFFNLIGNLSAADNIELAASVAGVSASEARARRTALMEELGIAARARLVPSRLSGGERQRVAIARALINRPAVLLADEPTGSLDSAAAQEVLGVIRKFHAAGQTTVIVTHDPRVASAADRVVRMRDGAITSETAMSRNGDERSRVADFVALEL